jgi:hypothetical protein
MYLDKIVIGSRVAPTKGLLVGFGVVIGIYQYSQQNLYHLSERYTL